MSCFASHVHRVQQVMDAAAAHGRKVALVGRSMVRNMGVARDLGYLQVPSVPGGLLVDLRDAEELPPEQIVLISTGSQGEPMSALSRMAGRDHPIRIAEGDTVILASSLVPGNETAVSRIINDLTRLGARVVHKGNALVHVSGHAPAGELLYVLNLVRPSNFIPVHGEWRHLKAHADLAALTGVPDEQHRDRRGRRGRRPGRRPDLGRRQGPVRLRVRGRAVGRRGDRDLAEGPADPRRRGLRLGGRSWSTPPAASWWPGPEIHARGSGIDEAAFDEIRPRIEEALARAAADGISDVHQLQQLVRRTVGQAG